MMSLLPEDSARMVGSSGLVVGIVFDALLAGSAEAVASSGTDGGSLASVFLVGCHVADAGVEPDGVVVGPLEVEFSAEYVDVGDEFEVGLFSLEVPEQRFDPCLVGRGAGPAEVGGEPAQCHELVRGTR